jgi:hypothetical protein
MTWTALMGLAAILALVTGPATAGAPLMLTARERGYPAHGCPYCHGPAPPTLNDRGKWLEAEKRRQQATAVDVDWLKSDPGDKKPE